MLITNLEYSRIREKLKGKTFRDFSEQILNNHYLSEPEYQAVIENTRDDRIGWWRDARFGLFIHYGLYSQTGYGEWHMGRNGCSVDEYGKLADTFFPAEDAAEQWIKTAKQAGAKYCVLTTRHHDGFSLWNSKVNPYNSVNYGCHRDIVQEFVDACRKYDMKIGFYSSLMDWYYPESRSAGFDPDARAKFLQYIEDLNLELFSQYGKIDVLWYDMPYPMGSGEGWNTLQRNQKIRALQPDIIINDRGRIPEDFTVCEECANSNNRDWESCITFNTISWGYIDEQYARNFAYTPQMLVKKLSYVCRNGGNLLLNIGPDGDGSIAQYEKETLEKLGGWISEYKEIIYGKQRRGYGLLGLNCYGEYGTDMLSENSAKDNTVYLWNLIWPKNGIIYLSGYQNAPKRIYSLKDNRDLNFSFENNRITIYGLGDKPFDTILGISVIAMEFNEPIQFRFCINCPQINDGYITE